jgi:hypothetical protein
MLCVPEDLHGLGVEIDDPVLADAMFFVEPFLFGEVSMGRSGRKNFRDEVRCSLNALLSDAVKAIPMHVEEIRLKNVGVGQLNVERGTEDVSLLVCTDESREFEEEIRLNGLMARAGGGRHDEVAVDKLVRGALGELLVVRVGVPVLFGKVDLGPVGGGRGHDAVASTLRRIHRIERSERPIRFR